MLLYEAFGGYCMICEQPITDALHTVDGRTGGSAPGLYDAAVWAELILLCSSCHASHREHAPTYRRSNVLLPSDDYAASPHPDAELDYVRTPVLTLTVVDGDTAHEATAEVVLVSGRTSRARRTIQHFALNSPFFDGEKLVVRAGDRRITEDGRLRARDTAWGVGDAIGREIDARGALDDARVAHFRDVLSMAGCWSSALAAVWAWVPDVEVARRLFASAHKKPVRVHRASGPVTYLGMRLSGNHWRGTRDSFFADLATSAG